jgi:hypothetical protein
MEKEEVVEDDETKTTMKVPIDLLDDFKHLAIDMKTTVTALIVESMRLYLKDIKNKSRPGKIDAICLAPATSHEETKPASLII